MTGRDAVREQLAAALHQRLGGARYQWDETADALLPVVDRVATERAAAAEQRGYERGRSDFQFAPEGDNHHNAALCPYCSPAAALRASNGQGTT